jgi:[acyl-carrier-protein] S-malonyltransferase
MFPGQGAQRVGMGRELAEAFPIARQTYDEANDVLGFDLAKACFEGPVEALMATESCQPAVLTTSVAAWRVARDHGLEGDLVLGHSLGEYAALVACGSLSFPVALRLVAERGAATTAVVRKRPGSMAALLGATEAEVEAMCVEAGVWPANYNCPGQVVASGLRDGIDRLMALAGTRGVKARLLDIDGAFHSSVMAPAAERLRAALETVKVATPSLPFISTTSAALERRAEHLRALLVQQLTAPVRFTAAVRAALHLGADQFVELGPSKVLTGLVRRVRKNVETFNFAVPEDLAMLATLRRGAQA